MTEQEPGLTPPTEPSEEGPQEGSRWRRYETAARERVATATAAAESRRSRSRLIDAVFLIRDRNRLLPASLLVGAMASRIVIYLVPLFALVIFSFGLYADVTAGSAAATAYGAGMPALFAEAASDSTSLHEGIKVAAVLATVYATLYAANSLGRLVRRSTALVWGVPYTRPARFWALPLVVVGLTLLAWLLGSLGVEVRDWDAGLFIGAVVLEVVLLTTFWLVVSRLLPRDPEAGKWSDLFPGALLAGVGVVGLRLAMVVYFANEVEQLSARYGSIGLALVMLTWAYWLGMIVIGTAELNAAVFRSRRARGRA